jgi:chaperonin cofactor prefoldin
MKKLSFIEKNNFVVLHQGAKYFSVDLELFRKHFFMHALNNDLARANPFTFERLDGRMLCALLDVVSVEEILAHRNGVSSPPAPPAPPAPADLFEKEIEALKARIDELEDNSDLREENAEKNDELTEEIDALRYRIEELEYQSSTNESELSELQSALEALEKKAFSKKKKRKKSSPQ